MDNSTPGLSRRSTLITVIRVLLILFAVLLLAGWLWYTPPGLFGKADALGYAVCHRITERSFFIDDRQTPLCARCTGMYLGAVLGIVYLRRFGRRAGLPTRGVFLVLGLFLLLFAVDGLNSYLHLFPEAPGLYEPRNLFRLLTGTGVGLGIASVLVPAVNQTLWQEYEDRPVLSGWRELLPLIGLALLLDLAVLSGVSLILLPLALISAFGVVWVLMLVYWMVWVMVTRQENRYANARAAWTPALAGFLTAMLQIAVVDAVRFLWTGTWAGFSF